MEPVVVQTFVDNISELHGNQNLAAADHLSRLIVDRIGETTIAVTTREKIAAVNRLTRFFLILTSLLCGCVTEPFSGASTGPYRTVPRLNSECIESAVKKTDGVVFISTESWASDHYKDAWGKRIETSLTRFNYELPNKIGNGRLVVREFPDGSMTFHNSFGRALRARFYTLDQLEEIASAVDRMNESVKNTCKVHIDIPPARKHEY